MRRGRVHIHTTLPRDLYQVFMDKVEKRFGLRKGSLRSALIEAIKLWLLVADENVNVRKKKISTILQLIEEIRKRGYVPLSEVNVIKLRKKLRWLIINKHLMIIKDKSGRKYITLRRYYNTVMDFHNKGLLIVDVVEIFEEGIKKLAYFLHRQGYINIDKEKVIV